MEEARPGSLKIGVISLNITPSMGKFGTVRTESVIRESNSSIAIDSVREPEGPVTSPIPLRYLIRVVR